MQVQYLHEVLSGEMPDPLIEGIAQYCSVALQRDSAPSLQGNMLPE
jgi:hypothetical protein